MVLFGRSRKIKLFATVGVAFCLLAAVVLAAQYRSLVSAETLENGARVEENSPLRYYLTVKGDGIDKDGIESSDTTTSEVRSGFLRVSDKLPDKLEFIDFVTTETGAFRAVTRNDQATGCHGVVVDDSGHEYAEEKGEWNESHTIYNYRGLHYNAETRTVDFLVRDLGAGCQLTIGIITRTPFLGQANRLDFYNAASLTANAYGKNSNTVHSWMGRDDQGTYKVSYQYTGEVPDGAPSIDSYPERNYASGVTVNAASSPILSGYEFSGWTADNVEINNGSFEMPAEDVVLTGSFTQKAAPTKYKVSYVIEGDAPKNYKVPKERSYSAGDLIVVDSSEPGSTLGEYVFQGWQSDDVEIVEGGFEMPAEDVEIKGNFRVRTYTVEYRFAGETLPPNAEALLPAPAQYPAGATVTRADNPRADGYTFGGWFKNATFEMPAEDVVIYGEWATSGGYIAPTISKTLSKSQSAYNVNDKVEFNITVTNTAAFPIIDVLVEEQLEGSFFEDGEGYNVETPQIASISELAAGASITLKAAYDKTNEPGHYENNTEIIAATTAENLHGLDPSVSYRATAEFDVVGEEGAKTDDVPEQPADEPSSEEPQTPEANINGAPSTYDSGIVIYVIVALGSLACVTYAIRRNKKA